MNKEETPSSPISFITIHGRQESCPQGHETATSLTCCNTQKSEPCTLPGQQGTAGLVVGLLALMA